MGGLLTHLSIATAGFLIGAFIFKNWKYGLGFFLGSLIPDIIDFGIAGISEGSLNPSVIMTNPIFHPLAVLGHTWWHWIIFGILVFLVLFLLKKKEKLSKDKFKVWIITEVFFLAGVYIHLLIDKLVIETSYWI